MAGAGAAADTLEWALVQAYQNNPSLNAQRASLRSTDENVPQALSGYRPKISVVANGGYDYSSTLTHTVNQAVFPPTVSYTNVATPYEQRGIAATAAQTLYNGNQTANRVRQAESQVMGARQTLRVTEQQVLLDAATAAQTLYNGNQTANRVRQAESQVMGARQTLRVTEQQVLLDAATSYMNLLRDQAILDLNRRNVEVLTEQLKQTRDRFNVGEVTRTDVAQAESRLAAGRSQLLNSQSNYVTSVANYRRVIGVDPGRLAPGTPVDRLSPNNLDRAIVDGQQQSPSVMAAMYGVDVAELAVKVSEGALYPNFAVVATASKNWEPTSQVNKQTLASIVGSLTVPLYQGGGEYSAIRQSKENLGQQRLGLDINRDQARATVTQSWGQLDAAKAEIESTTAQVNAAEIALNGVREEARVGQRTTLDVLNAQQELVNARVALVTAQHDRVVASYTLLAAVGGLSMPHLGLNVIIYDPQVHYQQVRDAWVGVRTPDGR
jgi:outer membrane protein